MALHLGDDIFWRFSDDGTSFDSASVALFSFRDVVRPGNLTHVAKFGVIVPAVTPSIKHI